MKKTINLAVIGVGLRGFGLICNGTLLNFEGMNVVAVCDGYEDRAQRAKAFIEKKTGKEVFATTDYKELLEQKNIDAVYVASAWEYHTEISVYALKKGIAVAMEVGGAYSEQELWELVRAQEETGTPFMFMENCCYDRCETMVTNMARAGLFGEIVHAEGSYTHDLRKEISTGNTNRHYRLRNYTHRNCENYPTHEIGPIAKLLNINRGNRFVSLVSVASKSAGLKAYVKAHAEEYPDLQGVDFKQGDVVDTILTCADGATVRIKLNTTLPRMYTRGFTVEGTKGFYEQSTNTAYVEGTHDDEWFDMEKYLNNAKGYEEEYLPDFWKNITPEQKAAGHGGMDYFQFRAFVDALKEGREMPIDVYDAATWMAVTVLSEKSILRGGQSVDFPDFTCGKWLVRNPKDVY